jgi:integrative and conjugative element protein (TIGR02256 family)
MWLRRRVGIAWISEAVVSEMVAEAERRSPSETGGVLLGYWSAQFDEVVIVEATGPGATAMHAIDRFSPDANFDVEEVARRYRESGRIHTYLGDWHTHPSGSARLSKLDHRTLARIARHQPARTPAPIMAVLAGQAPWSLAVWQFRRPWLRPASASSRRMKIRRYLA